MIRRPPRSTRTDTLFPYTTLFRSVLPLGARPIFQLSPTATILVASQAPGTKAHGSGIPFDDPSGDRLREWMGFSKEEFYDASKVAILPIGLCYPGRAGSGGRSEERRVGKECVSTCRSRWSPDH